MNGRNEVEADGTIADADVLGMEVAMRARIKIGTHARGRVGAHLQSLVQHQIAPRLDELAVVAEALEVGLLCAVDVKVVRVSGCDDGGIG